MKFQTSIELIKINYLFVSLYPATGKCNYKAPFTLEEDAKEVIHCLVMFVMFKVYNYIDLKFISV